MHTISLNKKNAKTISMTNPAQKKIRLLVIAFADSIHTSRWLAHLDRSKFDIHLFPSAPFRGIHPAIKDVTVHQLDKKDAVASQGLTFRHAHTLINSTEKILGSALTKKLVMKLGYKRFQKTALQKTIDDIRPDIIHTMETQRSGYLLNQVYRNNAQYSWIHSTWGIDLHYYRNVPGHNNDIENVLSHISMLIVEGKRDALLAKAFGCKAQIVEIPSVGGGFDFSEMDKFSFTAPSQRKKIMVKGYEGDERLASNVLKAMRTIKPRLNGYEVVVYSCSNKLLPLIDEIKRENEFTITHFSDTGRQEILQITSESRLSITNNLSDGVPNTMLEAMAMGAFPIQSNTAITEGWIDDHINGLLTDPININSIANAISSALDDDAMVDKAAEYNKSLTRKKLDARMIGREIENIYQSVVPV